MVDSLEKESLSCAKEEVGVGNGELGVVDGVERGGNVMMGLTDNKD